MRTAGIWQHSNAAVMVRRGSGSPRAALFRVTAAALLAMPLFSHRAAAAEPAREQKGQTVSTSAAKVVQTNRLALEKSPYLLQHQHNPVDWYGWGDEAFSKARRENKPIFLSIGYSTCHWCHVMERESFEDPKLAAFLNSNYVSIKVDREERPDVDKIYMTAVQAMGQGGGWPLNAFLTPELKPFYGGTYFPPESKYGRPSFLQVLQKVSELWKSNSASITSSAADLHRQLEEFTAKVPASSLLLTPALLTNAARLFKSEYDPQHGGFGGAPKFPRPSQPAFLLRHGVRAHDEEAIKMVLHTCRGMAAGGIYDQIGGGFARYSVDAQWLVPHFEKMLYDNAQLIHLYLDAYLISRETRYADVARDIIRYVLRDMTHPGGGFYSAEDADSEGKEGKFYCWTEKELRELLLPDEFKVAKRYFGVTPNGNFVDHSDPNPLPEQNVLSIVSAELRPEEKPLLESARQKMFAARAKRVRPHLDDKILTSWNGLMLGAIARAYAVLEDPACLKAATRNFDFITTNLWDKSTGTLYHRWRDGHRDTVQLLDAYAFFLAGTLDLYEATLEPRYLEMATAVAERMCARFFDSKEGGFWQSPAGSADLILRVKEDYDGAEPSGNSVACLALLRLGAIADRADFKKAAEQTLRLFASRLQSLPQAVPNLLMALDFWLEEPKRAVIVGKAEARERKQLIHAAHQTYQPNKVVLGQEGPVEAFAKTLPAKGAAVVYVCTGTACQPPTQDATKLKDLLK